MAAPGHRAASSAVFNIAGARPFSLAPAIAPAILVIGSGSYGVLYAVAGLCAIIGAFAILPVRVSDESSGLVACSGRACRPAHTAAGPRGGPGRVADG